MEFDLKFIKKYTVFEGGGVFSQPMDPNLGQDFTHWIYDFDYKDHNGVQDLHVRFPKEMVDAVGKDEALLRASQDAIHVVIRNSK